MQKEDHLRGAVLTVLSAFFFAGAGAMVKVVSSDLPTTMVVFFRSGLALLAVLPYLLRNGIAPMRSNQMGLHVARAISGMTAMYCFFFAISRLHLAEAVLLNYTAPIFIPFLAAAWLREKIPRLAPLAAVVGLAGVAIILKPGAGLWSGVATIGLVGGLASAVSFVGIRGMARNEPVDRMVFWFGVISTAITAVPLVWTWQTPRPALWLPLIALGVLASIGQMLLTRAYGLASAATLGPLSYATVVFAAIFGWVAWGEVLDGTTLAGTLLVAAAGLISARGAPSATIAAAEPTDLPPVAEIEKQEPTS